jgi:hypothetical protein
MTRPKRSRKTVGKVTRRSEKSAKVQRGLEAEGSTRRPRTCYKYRGMGKYETASGGSAQTRTRTQMDSDTDGRVRQDGQRDVLIRSVP